MARIRKTEIIKMNDDDYEKQIKAEIEELKERHKELNKIRKEKKSAFEKTNRTKINHAKFLVAGEFLKTEEAISFLEKMIENEKTTERNKEDLKLLLGTL